MLHSTVIPRGHSRKLHCPWTGPYKVINKLSDIIYRTQRCHGRKRLVVHFNRLKSCPLNIRDNSRQSQDSQLSYSHVAELKLSRQVPCEQLAYVPDDESSSELIPETSPYVEETSPNVKETSPNVKETSSNVEETSLNVEETSPNVDETVVTSLSGSSDVVFT